MPNLKNIVTAIDNFQQRHHVTAFGYAVIKKYGEDSSGQRAALLTYYAFLSLFPLLLVFTTVTDMTLGSHPHLEKTVTKGLTDYFPSLGSQLSSHVHTIHGSGLALIIGILFTLYGARGVAQVFRESVQRIWGDHGKLAGSFQGDLLKNLSIILVGGLGFVGASILAGVAAAAGHGLAFRLLSLAINLFILFWLFTFLINFSLPKQVSLQETRVGAVVAAIGLVILQTFGTYLLSKQLKSLDALYSNFAIPLGLLFWIYLQAQLLYYAVTVAAVSSQKLWPRSLS